MKKMDHLEHKYQIKQYYETYVFETVLPAKHTRNNQIVFNKTNHEGMSRTFWSHQEDKALRAAIERIQGKRNWSSIAEKMKMIHGSSFRNAKQCRQRWFNYLQRQQQSPSVSQTSQNWSPDLDWELMRIVAEIENKGKKWVHIAELLNKHILLNNLNNQLPSCRPRSAHEVKNRFYSIFKKGIRRINSEVGKPIPSQQIRLLKPKSICSVMNSVTREQSLKYLSIIHDKTHRVPFRGQNCQQNERRILELLFSKEGNISEENKDKNSKKRKQSLTTNVQENIQEFNENLKVLESISQSPVEVYAQSSQEINFQLKRDQFTSEKQIINDEQFWDIQINKMNDKQNQYIEKFIQAYPPDSEDELQFEQLDFGI